MPWGRLDDKANGNAKLLALSDSAWRMWGCGLIYCQDNLTDGFIAEHAISAFGVRAKNKELVAAELCRSLVPNKGPLWHKVEGGFQVHDYLDWNDSREEVLRERKLVKDRKEKFNNRRDKNASKNASRNASENAFQNASGNASKDASGTLYHDHVPQSTPTEKRGSAPETDPILEDTTERKANPVSRLLDVFVSKYQETVGLQPHISRPKDPAILSALLAQHNEGAITAAIEAMFKHGDGFVKRHYSIGILKSQFNGFLANSALAKPSASAARASRPVTAAERERATTMRRAWGRCQHSDVLCATSVDCIAKIIADQRAKEIES